MIFLNNNRASLALLLLIGIVFTNSLALASTELQEKQIVAQQRQCQAAITRQDLPARFKEMPASDLEDIRQALAQEELTVNQITEFETDNFPIGFIQSGTVSLSDRLARENPRLTRQILLRTFAGTFEDVVTTFPGVNLTVGKVEELPDFDNIGDSSAAWKIPMRMADFLFRTDLVVFQRGKIVAFVGVGYIEGDVAAVSVGDLARKLDARILATCH